jgi:predicted nucleic-acid-binding protein
VIGLDTNVLVRYIAQDDPAQSARATAFVEKDCSTSSPGFIAHVVLVEVVWVCERCYGATRADIAEILRTILSSKQLVVEDAETAWQALRLFESTKADFADALIERTAKAAGRERVVTFDKHAAQSGMVLLR